jgi:hypothetical protein
VPIKIKEFQGYSGSTVLLLQDHDLVFVRKINNVARNIERLTALKDIGINIPEIISLSDNQYDMKYIPHVDMVTWLLHNPIDQFISWMIDCINKLKEQSFDKNWEEVYNTKLTSTSLDQYWSKLKFTSDELIARLPKQLPASNYHGDLTMENCIYSNDGQFYMIDPITTDYNSWIFDLAKLMQDLESGWFIRNKKVIIQGKLWAIRSFLLDTFPQINNPNLLILMLLRVLPYTKTIKDQQFIIKEVNRLWI